MGEDQLFEITMKRCSVCRAVLPLDAFHRNRRRKDGRQTFCRTCNIERNKRWYREHPEARTERMDEYARLRREQSLFELWRFLVVHPCVDCGETDPIVLEFDHLRDKVANVAMMASAKKPWPTILAEIEKCDVVCANCHRRRTCARANSFRHRMGRLVEAEAANGTLPPTGA